MAEKSEDKAVGRFRGGLNTKIYAVVDGLGNPVEFLLSAGNHHDSVHAIALLEKVTLVGSNVLAYRAYGANAIRTFITENGAFYTVPPQRNVLEPWSVNWRRKECHLVECFFQKLKTFRHVATRYDKLLSRFASFVHLACIMILLK